MDILDWYARIITGREAVIFEFGCHDGYHTRVLTRLADRLCRGYRYIALEPDSRVFPHAQAAVRDNPAVTLLQAAVHCRGGLHRFHLSSGVGADGSAYSGSSSLLAPAAVTEVWPGMRFDSTAMVQCHTYDDLFANAVADLTDFVWADIQGSEIDLIRGGPNALKRTRYLYVEYSNGGLYQGDADLDGLCRALGRDWEVAEDFKGDALLRNKTLDGIGCKAGGRAAGGYETTRP